MHANADTATDTVSDTDDETDRGSTSRSASMRRVTTTAR